MFSYIYMDSTRKKPLVLTSASEEDIKQKACKYIYNLLYSKCPSSELLKLEQEYKNQDFEALSKRYNLIFEKCFNHDQILYNGISKIRVA